MRLVDTAKHALTHAHAAYVFWEPAWPRLGLAGVQALRFRLAFAFAFELKQRPIATLVSANGGSRLAARAGRQRSPASFPSS